LADQYVDAIAIDSADGKWFWHTYTSDIFNTTSPNWVWNFTIDTTKPIITNLQPPNGTITRDGTPTISANYSDSSGINVTSVLLKINDIDETSNATILASGTKLHNRIFFEGNYTIYLEVKDNAGNLATATWSFVIDFTLPTITNLQPPPSSELTGNPLIISADYYDANGINVSSVLLKVDDIDVTLDSTVTANNVSFLPSSTFVDGVHFISLEVRDIAGNLNTQKWTFIVDATPLEIINKQPSNASTTNYSKPEISANFSNPLDINVSSILLRVDSIDVTAETIATVQGVYYLPDVELTNGTHTIYLEVRDRIGNLATASWYFIVDIPQSDTTPPTITNLRPLNASTITNNYTTISANYSDLSGINISSVILLVDGVDVTSSSIITEKGITYIPLEPLSNGNHTVYLEVKDNSSSHNRATKTWTFTISTSPDTPDITPSKDFLSEYWWILVIIVAIIVLLIVFYLFKRKKDSKKLVDTQEDTEKH